MSSYNTVQVVAYVAAGVSRDYLPLNTSNYSADANSVTIVTGAGATDWASITGKPTTFDPVIGSLVTQGVAGNDTRLTNARVPTAHAASHQDAGSDEISVLGLSGLLADTQKPIIGSLSTQAVAGNDARLTDARTPLAHVHAIADVTNLQAGLDAKQPIDTDLTTIAGLTATTDNFMVAAASAWASRTPSQAKTSLALVKGDVGLGSVDNTADTAKPVSSAQQTALDGKQTLDTDLTTIAGLTATTDNFMVATASAWASRTPTQARSQMGLGTAATTAATDYATAAQGVDSRTPLAHATSHKAGGSDAIKLDEMAAPTDITTLNATTALHGLLLKLDGLTTTFLRGDGTWAAPTAATPDLIITANSTNAANRVVPAGYSAYIPSSYEIGAGFQLEIAASAAMEIG